MKTVCLITQSHLSMNPRLIKEADALVEAGFAVRVIATDSTPWARKTDKEFEGRLWQPVVKVCFGPDAPFLQRLKQIISQRVARLLLRMGVKHPGIVCAAWHPVGPELVTAAKKIKADFYIAHYPAALPAAAIAAANQGVCYAFDAEDFHLGDPPDGAAYEFERLMTRQIEGRYLPGCAYISAASPGIADAYAGEYRIERPMVVRNVFPLSNAPAKCTKRGDAKPAPSIYWFSQTIGENRGLECAMRAVGIARTKPHLFLRGTPQSGFINKLRSIAIEVGANDQLHILPPAAPSEMERLAAIYDIGLVGETGVTFNRRIALTNKIFTYMLAGVPAVVSDIPAHRDFSLESGIAVRLYSTDDPVSLAAKIDEFLEGDGSELARARRHAFLLGQKCLNWGVEKKIFLQKISGILA